MKTRKTLKPCGKCPYKLGQVKFAQNPCTNCKANDYKTYYETLSKVKQAFIEIPELKIR